MVTLPLQAFRRKARPNSSSTVTPIASVSLPPLSQLVAHIEGTNTAESTDNVENNTALICARIDPDTHEPIILWDDILQAFPDAQCIFHEGVLVPFMVDRDFNPRKPKRVPYLSGAVFDVVSVDHRFSSLQQQPPNIQRGTNETTDSDMIEVQEQDVAMSMVMSERASESPVQSLPGQSLEKNEPTSPVQVNRTLSGSSRRLLRSSSEIPEKPKARPRHPQTSTKSHGELVDVVDIMPIFDNLDEEENLGEQERHKVIGDIASVSTSTPLPSGRHSGRTKSATIAEGTQCHLKLVTSSSSYAMHSSFEWPLSEPFPEALDSADKLFEISTRIGHRINYLLYGSLDWDRHTIPRLFIVLPNEWDYLSTGSIEESQLVLHFLCECGPHTATPTRARRRDHIIHRTSHNGFVIRQPDVFFRKYGAYVLLILYAVKVDYILGGYSGFSYSNPFDDNTPQIYKMVDAMIDYLEKRDIEFSITESTEFMEKTCQLDLAALSSHLVCEDEANLPTGLYRYVVPYMAGTSDPDGPWLDRPRRVTWICHDHFHRLVDTEKNTELIEMVQSLNGSFNDSTRTLNVALSTPESALEFYAALKRSGDALFQLVLSLGWDPTFYDLIELADSISSTSIVDLTIDGSHSQKEIYQYLDKGTRFEAIIAMITGNVHKLCTIKLVGFMDYFLRDQIIPFELLSLVTEIDARLPSSFGSETTQEIFEQMILPYSVLKKMTFNGPPIESSSKVFIYNKLAVSTLVLQGRGSTLSLQMGEPVVKAAWTVPSLASLRKEDLSGISRKKVVQLTTEEPVALLYCNIQLSDILTRYPWLTKLDLACDLKDFEGTLQQVSRLMERRRTAPRTKHEIIRRTVSDMFSNTLWGIPGDEYPPPNNLDSDDENYMYLDTTDNLSTNSSGSNSNSMPWECTLRTPNNGPVKVKLFSAMGEYGRCESEVVLKKRPTNDLSAFLAVFGWSVRSLVANEHWSDDLTAFMLSSKREGRNMLLQNLELNPRSMTKRGVENMCELIDMSKETLKRLSLQLTSLHLNSMLWNATELLFKYSDILIELCLSGQQPMVWFPKITEVIWSHRDAPLLETLSVEFEEEDEDEDEDEEEDDDDDDESMNNSKVTELSGDVAEWLIQMIRLPPSAELETGAGSTAGRPRTALFHPLRTLELTSVHLSAKGWNEFVEAIDFTVLTKISLVETNISCTQISKLAGLLPRESPRAEPQSAKEAAKSSVEAMRQLFSSLGIDPNVHSKSGQTESSSTTDSSSTKAKAVSNGSCGNLEAYVHTHRQQEARRRLAARMGDKDCRIKFTVLWRGGGEELALVTVERH